MTADRGRPTLGERKESDRKRRADSDNEGEERGQKRTAVYTAEKKRLIIVNRT